WEFEYLRSRSSLSQRLTPSSPSPMTYPPQNPVEEKTKPNQSEAHGCNGCGVPLLISSVFPRRPVDEAGCQSKKKRAIPRKP
ncbi:MAG: hypothetical protein ACK6EB_07810, partial [Planctomyces sp.]